MTTVLCGYEGCDWKFSMHPESFSGLDNDAYAYLKAALNDHEVEEHNVPTAIWER